MRLSYITIAFIVFTSTLSAQKLSSLKYKELGFEKLEIPFVFESSTILLLPNSDLAVLGVQNQYLYYFRFNNSGILLETHESSLDYPLTIHNACYTFDGSFIIGGLFSRQEGSVKAGLLLLDENGIPKAQKTIALDSDSKDINISLLLQNTDGHILTAFYDGLNTQTQRFQTVRDSIKAMVRIEEVDKKPNLLGPYKINDYAKKDTTEIGLAGTSKAGRLVFHKINSSGKGITPRKSMKDYSIKEGRCIIYHPYDKQYIIGGSYRKSSKNEAYLIFLDQDGKPIKDKTFAPISDKGSISHIIPRPNGILSCIGDYKTSGSMLWVMDINPSDPDGVSRKYHNNTGHFPEIKFAAYFSKEDKILLIEDQSGHEQEYYLSILEDVSQSVSTETIVSIQKAEWIEEVKNDTIDVSERAYLKIYWQASASQPSHFQLKLQLDKDIMGLEKKPDYFIEISAGQQSGIAAISVIGRQELQTDSLLGSVQVRTAHDSTLVAIPKIYTQSSPIPVLYIKDACFFVKNKEITETDTLIRGDTITAKVRLSNIGKATAKNVLLQLKLPYHVANISPSWQRIDSLQAKQDTILEFILMPYSYYRHDQLRFDFFANEKVCNRWVYQTWEKPLRNIFALEKIDGSFYTPIEIIEYQQNKGGPSPSFQFYRREIDSLKILIPSEEGEPEFKSRRIPLSIRIRSSISLTKNNIRITRTIREGEKEIVQNINEYDLWQKELGVLKIDSSVKDCQYCYSYQNDLLLAPLRNAGNSFKIEVINNHVPIIEPTQITVVYDPPVRHQRVYFLGVPSGSEDDKKFIKNTTDSLFQQYLKTVSTLNNQSFFKTITPQLIIEEELTTSGNLRAFFKTIHDEFLNSNKNLDENIEYTIVFYIIAHATGNKNGTRITCSDNTKYNFLDIIDKLKSLPLSKFIFLNTCYSNTSQITLRNEEEELKEGYAFGLVSSATKEDSIRYGKFPVMISTVKDAFNDINSSELRDKKRVDYDKDGLISFQEIESYIKSYASNVLKELRSSPQASTVDSQEDLPQSSIYFKEEETPSKVPLMGQEQAIGSKTMPLDKEKTIIYEAKTN